ncbi:MAG: acyltransferase family protein [Blastocatellia bacterium]
MQVSSKRIPELDGLRGLAILLVLLGHFFGGTIAVPADSIWVYAPISLRLTWSGVDLFFVLSGFLIGGILLDHREATNYYKVFYLRRACRIFPAYYLTLFLFYALIAFGASRVSPWLFDKPLPSVAYLTFTQNIWSVWFVAHFGYPAFWPGVTWSLAVEEQFYVIISTVVRKWAKFLPWILTGVIILAPLLRVFCYFTFPLGGLMNYLCLPMRADALLLGVLAAYALRRDSSRQWVISHSNVLVVALAVLGGGLVLLNAWRQELALSGSKVMTTIGYSWVEVFYACLLLLVVTQTKSALAALFRNGALRWLGEISYGLYLIHIPVLGLCHALAFKKAPVITNSRELLVTLGALVISLLLALISWKFLEQRIIKWGRSCEYQMPSGK